MKIVFASKYYYRRGGLEAYLFKAKSLLEDYGDEVIPFSTDYYENVKSEYSMYFCKYYDLSRQGMMQNKISDKLKAIKNMYFNNESYRKMRELIRKTEPDIIQGFGVTRHLSYSVFKAAKELNIPTIMRLSDYALLCPNTTGLDGWGEICSNFDCSKNNLLKILKRRCIHNSLPASLIGKLEFTFNTLLQTYKRNIDLFIAPSRFIRETFINNFGLEPERIIYIPVFIDSDNIPFSDYDDGYFLFAGRLSREKGVLTLLNALKNMNHIKLIIAGTGPMESALKKIAEENELNVDFLGFQEFTNLQKLIKRCRAVIVPSEWYENSPNIVLEAFSFAKPVIGSHIGGLSELVVDNETGLTFKMGNAEDLRQKIEYLLQNQDRAAQMGKNAKSFVGKELSPEKHYQELVRAYKIIKTSKY